MRMFAAFVLLAGISAGEAQASSLVMLEPLKTDIGPSIILVGETPGGAVVQTQETESGSTVTLSSVALASPSITLLSEPEGTVTPSVIVLNGPDGSFTQDRIAVAETTVPDAGRSTPLMPMVIRGGLVGDALLRPAPPSSTQSAEALEPALDPDDRGTPSKRKALKRQAERQRALQASESAAEPTQMPETE